MFNSLKRWKDKNNGLHDAADVADVLMAPPNGWTPVEVFDASENVQEEE